ncbi:MAG: hypothetical protein ABIE74_12340 [Pseudomonadota bacterium]
MKEVFLRQYFTELINIFDKVDEREFKGFISELILAYENAVNIFIFGNGGSAVTSSLE